MTELGRREFLARSLALAGAAAVCRVAPVPPALAKEAPAPASDDISDASVIELQARMERGALDSLRLTQHCLERIERLDRQGPALHAVIELNPDAFSIAAARDAERKAGKVRGPLHGIPILIKDNIDTRDRMKTSAGSLALAQNTAPRDAFIVERLRASGAVLLGKTNLSEWANFRSTHSTSGWSARGGLTKNPHALDRNTSGSSSGTGAAIAAGFAALGIGTETDGSIISPASVCGIVGIKPTVGLWGRSGIVPISASQDTAGPMARTVADAALLLGPLAGLDPRDAATRASQGKTLLDYTSALDARGLKGARIGVPRNLAGFHPAVDDALDESVAALRSAGAVVLDSLELSTVGQFDDAELDVLLYEFKAGLQAYLGSLAASPSAGSKDRAPPLRTLADVIRFNDEQRSREMPWFGQELFERAEKKGPLSDEAYKAARKKCLRLARDEGLDSLSSKHHLDALVCPSNQPAWVTDLVNGDHYIGGNTSFAAVAGYPSITVPMGSSHGLPLGLSFIGRAFSEAKLIRLAYAFEQETRARILPGFPATSA
jgi:amidase